MAEIRQKLGFDAEGAINTLGKLSEALDKANASLSKMKTSAAGAKSLNDVEKQTKKTTKAANEFLVSWKTIIRVLETQLIVRGLNTIITGMKDAVESARELGLAIEEVRTIDAAGRTASDISEQVLRLSDAIGQVPTDLAEGLYQTLSNQVVEAADSFQLMSEAARLAKVTASETGDAVNALSSVMNSYNLAASEAEHVSGTLFATVEQGRLRLGEIANVIGRVTPLTAQLGITWEETAASIATMTRQGVRADTAITQLRAVVTRLLKPTDEVREVFRKWGVEDGRQAIQTFGGLSGVLKKLAQETGNNSGEMAELLRNVRAIAGVFGIMSNEGETLEEVLTSITGATKDATEAWSQYSQSEAQQLTVEMQKFDNIMTRLGTTTVPAIVTVLKGLNLLVEGIGRGILIVTGNWGAAEEAAEAYERAVRAGIQDGIDTQKAWADAGRGAYEVITKASLKYYAEANKQEQKLATVRDNAIASATAAFESIADQLTDAYSDNLKKIEKFADQAREEIEKSLGRIVDIRRDMEDRALEYNLEAAKSNYKKLELLNADYLKKLEKRNKAAAQITADPKTIESTRDAQDELVKSLDKRGDFLGKIGASEERISKNFDLTEKSQKEMIRHELTFAKESGKVAFNTDKARENFADSEARAKEIVERMKEIHSQGEISPMDRAELASLQTELDAVIEKGKEATKVFEDLGLDINFTKVVDGLTEALNQAHKDWDAEVAIAIATFSKAVIPIQISLDPGGAVAAFQKQLGQTQLPGETAAAFAGRGDLAAQKTLQKELDLTTDIAKLRAEGNKPLKETSDQLTAILEKGNAAAESARNRALTLQSMPKYMAGARQRLSEALQLDRARGIEASKLQVEFSQMVSTLQQGKLVEDQSIQALRQRLEAARNNNAITQQTFEQYSKVLDQLSEQSTLSQKINELEKQRAPQAEVDAATKVLQAKQGVAEATKVDAQQQEAIKQREAERAEAVNRTKAATEGTANATERTANASGNAANQAGNFTTNTSGALSPLSTAVSLSEQVAANMAAAAASAAEMAAASAGGASATAYHGGPHYADGGMFRGQDQQLAALAKGEMVVNQKQSRRFFSELNAMNQGSQPVYREQGGSVTNVGDVNVTVQGGDSSQQTVREIGHALRREIKRGNLRLR